MSRARLLRPLAAVLLAVPCVGCLEVEQHPGWVRGQYDGKPDPLPSSAMYHGDRFAWWAAISDRNQRQDEYHRTFHRGGRP